MKLGAFTVMYNEKPLEEVAAYLAGLGYEGLELPAWRASNHLDIERVVKDEGYAREIRGLADRHGLSITALSNHLDGKLILGPLDATTDDFAPTTDPDEKVAFGIERMKATARAAAALEVPVVVGFTGSHVWDKWYSFPPDNESAYEEAWALFAARWDSILDVFETEGVRFALEVHPGEIAYNIETTERALQALDRRPSFGLNFDPSHFVWQFIDPVIFIHEFGDRIYHAHAKDAELQKDRLARSGVVPNGSWTRPDRGFRFRVPGWGDVEWKRVMTALLEERYDYALSFEHEDPVMSREDGCEQNLHFMRSIRINEPLGEWGVWWGEGSAENEAPVRENGAG